MRVEVATIPQGVLARTYFDGNASQESLSLLRARKFLVHLILTLKDYGDNSGDVY